MTGQEISATIYRLLTIAAAVVLSGCGVSESLQYAKEPTMAKPESTPIQRYQAAESAKELKDARRDFVQELLTRHGKPGDTAAHLDPYQGYKFSKRADQLLREWNPIFFHTDELRALLGDPQQTRETVLVYSFTVGPIQKHWEFKFDTRNVIVGVEYIPGE